MKPKYFGEYAGYDIEVADNGDILYYTKHLKRKKPEEWAKFIKKKETILATVRPSRRAKFLEDLAKYKQALIRSQEKVATTAQA